MKDEIKKSLQLSDKNVEKEVNKYTKINLQKMSFFSSLKSHQFIDWSI